MADVRYRLLGLLVLLSAGCSSVETGEQPDKRVYERYGVAVTRIRDGGVDCYIATNSGHVNGIHCVERR